MTGILKFIHMTDTHLLDGDRLLYGVSPKDRLTACFRHIKTNHPDAAFVVITGDIADNGSYVAYRQLCDTVKEFGLVVFVIPGNHDNINIMRLVLPEFNGNLNEIEPGTWMPSFITSESCAYVFLDTTSHGVDHGIFDHDQAEILKNCLSNLSTHSIFLFMHHPPFDVGIPAMDMINLLDPEPLYSALVPFKPNIRHIFLGHLHKTIHGTWRGMPFSAIRSTVHQVCTKSGSNNLNVDAVACCNETPEYSIVEINSNGVICNAERFAENVQIFY